MNDCIQWNLGQVSFLIGQGFDGGYRARILWLKSSYGGIYNHSFSMAANGLDKQSYTLKYTQTHTDTQTHTRINTYVVLNKKRARKRASKPRADSTEQQQQRQHSHVYKLLVLAVGQQSQNDRDLRRLLYLNFV